MSEVNMLDTRYVSTEELEAGMHHIRQAPREVGVLKMIIRRPAVDEREMVQEAELTLEEGLVGDTWRTRGSRHNPDRSARKEAQVTLMNARIIELIAQSEDRWALAGDQLYVDFDLSDEHIPPGTHLSVGSAVLEVSALPHTGCKKFSARFGVEAMKFVNSPEGRQLHLRGINTRVIRGGAIHVGDAIRKLYDIEN
jgi:MOSC domain-containing protein YiiM